MQIFDTHTHLSMRDFQGDLNRVISRAKEIGVQKFICVGFDFRSSGESVALSEGHDGVFAAVGVHPHDARIVHAGDFAFLESLLTSSKVVAWGEIGLDYFRDLSPREAQKSVFRAQIQLAKKHSLPIIVHDRDAHQDVLRILKEEKAKEIGGVMHCFSASWKEAKEALDLNFYISFAGNLTYPSSKEIQEAAKRVPKERILVETDSPYLKPWPDRRGRNEPMFVALVLRFLAELRQEKLEDLAEISWENSHALFLRHKVSAQENNK
jgi:TatD DNase family protein